jgi:hypothetical protein
MIIEIVIFLCFIAPLIPLLLMLAIWHFFFEKNAKRLQRLYRRMDNITLKCKGLLYSDKQPFGEIRIPAMILGVSGLVFTLLTTMFGVGINWNTHTVEFFWAIDKSPDLIDPMQQFPDYVWAVMFIGYYVAVAFMIYMWFEYCKFRWMNIPNEYRVKTIEIKNNKKEKKELFVMNGRRKS